MPNPFIAYCGLNCENCPARIATINDDQKLREKVAKEWSELNQANITPEMINCLGCRVEGPKTPYCESLCPISEGKRLLHLQGLLGAPRMPQTRSNPPPRRGCQSLHEMILQ